MKLALILNAINPAIGGVLIRGEKGTAKSTAVRALARLLPEQDVVEGCHFGCHPEDVESLCSDCRLRFEDGENPLPGSGPQGAPPAASSPASWPRPTATSSTSTRSTCSTTTSWTCSWTPPPWASTRRSARASR